MANVSVTSQCNRSCSFCFAPEPSEGANGHGHMTLETFERSLDFLCRSGVPEARLLGGEPTLHPEFPELLDRALARDLRLLVFSGGLIPARSLDALEQVPEDRLTLLLNVPLGDEAKDAIVRRQHELFTRLGRRVLLGVTIDHPGVELGFLLDWIVEFDLRRALRLGLGHPRLGADNSALHPRHYPEVGARVAELGFAARERGIRLDFDCGWVPCMFPPDALRALGIGASEVGHRCSPILDVLPDGDVISCYPLAEHHREPLPDSEDASWLRARFADEQKGDRAFMLYKACASCGFRARGECVGGCLSASLGRLRRREFKLLVPLRVPSSSSAM